MLSSAKESSNAKILMSIEKCVSVARFSKSVSREMNHKGKNKEGFIRVQLL